ncbi:MAG: hypothetical protein ABJG07_04005 [Qipengyuania citrea]|uniref:hypothetical protein n=1 Tax=Qipengyuania citrea TaxID=225971 RepID=UPI00326711D4
MINVWLFFIAVSLAICGLISFGVDDSLTLYLWGGYWISAVVLFQPLSTLHHLAFVRYHTEHQDKDGQALIFLFWPIALVLLLVLSPIVMILRSLVRQKPYKERYY